MPHFMCLLYDDQKTFSRLSPDEMQKAMEKYMAWRKAPFTVDGKRLDDDLGKVIRANGGGEPTATDGPFSESKEILGGYYTIQAADYDDAVKITLTHPHLEYGGTIELRKSLRIMTTAAAEGGAERPQAPDALIEHLFRRQAGRMVSHLARLLGSAYLSVAEEAVQDSMLRALSSWPYDGVPQNPEGWLFRVAHNAAIDAIRHRRMADSKAAELTAELHRAVSHPVMEQTFRDDELSLIFMCCHPAIAPDSRIALSLKTACGFSVREIARAFLAAEDAVAQRIVRAKKQIRDQHLSIEMPSGGDLDERIDSVLAVIYSMFNEGYSANEGEDLIRLELCREALRLGLLIASSALGRPKVHALVALMALQAARIPARVDDAGDLVLLEDQDPSRWDDELIALGFHHFDLAIAGPEVSRYHIESAIAASHAQPAKDWRAILELYDQLLELDPGSAVVRLNRAVAVARVEGAAAGLAAIEPLVHDRKLAGYHLLEAVRAHFLMETGDREAAASAYRAALECRCSMPERRFLERKLSQALGQ